MASIESLQEKMKQASQMMSEMQEELQALTQKADEGTTFDFARLRHLGKQKPFSGHPLGKCSNPAEYLTLLLTVLVKQSEVQEDEWLILYRIAAGANYQGDVHDLLAGAMNMKATRMLEIVKMIARENLVEVFLVDSLMLYKNGMTSEPVLKYLADLYDLMGVDAETLKGVIELTDILQSNHEHISDNGEAFNSLGDIFYYNQEYEHAVKFYRRAAEQGNVFAQDNLGLCFANGEGVKQSHEEAVRWYRTAAENGLAEAQNHLGVKYQMGEGVPKNLEEANRWYRKAADQGDAWGQCNLGCIYYDGDGVWKDYDKALSLFRKSAAQGNSKAQHYIGYCYYRGYGVTLNYAKAREWFEKAAEQGYPNAQYLLGWCYRTGQGGAVNIPKAREWYQRAAEQGHQKAKEELNKL